MAAYHICFTEEFFEDAGDDLLKAVMKPNQELCPNWLIGQDITQHPSLRMLRILQTDQPMGIVYVRGPESKIQELIDRFRKINKHATFVIATIGEIGNDFASNLKTAALKFCFP